MAQKKIKILLFIPSLTPGGAERVMLFIAKNLSQEKFNIKLVVIGFENDTIYDTEGVEVIYLKHQNVKNAFFDIFRLFFVHRPHIAFGSLTHVNYIIGLVSYFFPQTICVARETIVLSIRDSFKGNHKAQTKKKGFLSFLDSKISDLAHQRINYYICQSEDMKKDMVQIDKYAHKRITTINNPVSEQIKTKKDIPVKKPLRFITVGRLSKQKGYERIIGGLSKLTIPFTYTIIGDGTEKDRIFKVADYYKLTDKIEHIPVSKEVYEHMSSSHIYLQGSFFEGFPNALIESLGIGTPAIVFDAPGGMNEIMVDGENGYLVKDDSDFVEKLTLLIHKLDNFPPKKVSSHVLKKFGWKKIISDYENFFERITS
ncbi:glycosyltransferase [Allomuricauda sp. ARW1Y1]|uniref:glycosyltransferase n=1 Tax=Allomuricauda sp. ARW1Y1 TaxID=2663843 RepID=UPI0015C9BA33|nr:glycosyltransferase [Muricauda sp. ARW1Y1]NYJ28037.1 glycosyltransferase involved in cell wall biosynthesis [Muricauda sp. ARW1Y1]